MEKGNAVKNLIKKNQLMITALAIMIAIAGYLQFAGTNLEKEYLTSDNTEDLSAVDSTDIVTDIESLDSDVILEEENYLDESMSELAAQEISGEAAETIGNEISESETPGEAVFTSATSLNTLSGARLLKEQTRAKNKETLLEIINNVNITEDQKQTAIDNMITMTEIAEKETSAEILLESKGFEDVVVSITDENVDVVVNASELSEAQRAQIEDIVIRKTGVAPEAIVISTFTSE